MISAFSNIEPVDPIVENQIGSAKITIIENNDNVQKSNFAPDSFQVTNTGDKRIAAIYIDVTEALFPDTVFDPQGLAGDTVARGLFFKSTGSSGAYKPAVNKNDPNVIEPFYGVGGTSGYEGMLLTFDSTLNNGYEPGEVIEFGVDMDPNSIRGLPQQPIDIDGNDPRLQVNGKGWDIGGVSGAELLNAKVHILFTDGTEAVGEFISDGSQAGAVAVASQVGFNKTLNLSVNGLNEGKSGTYNENDIQVLVSGNPGDIARVTLVKGFIQPFEYTDVDGNRIDLSDLFTSSPFPANNAIQVQTKDVELDGTVQAITDLFDFGAPGENVTGAPGSNLPRFLGDDALPLGFTASIVDAQGLPISDVTEPIYLIHESMPSSHDDSPLDRDPPIPTLSINNVSVIEGDERVTFIVSLSSASVSPVTVNYSTADESSNSGSDYVETSGVVTFASGVTRQSIEIGIKNDRIREDNETFIVKLRNPVGASIGDRKIGRAIIQNDDGDRLKGTRRRDRLRGTSFSDVLVGKSGNDRLLGRRGDDKLKGGNGNDRLKGHVGHDILVGGRGDDRLVGGSGEDFLKGGKGNDTMIGGPGDDLFVFGRRDGIDTIRSFDVNSDRLRFKGIKSPSALDIQNLGQDTLINYKQSEVVLKNIQSSKVTNDIFVL